MLLSAIPVQADDMRVPHRVQLTLFTIGLLHLAKTTTKAWLFTVPGATRETNAGVIILSSTPGLVRTGALTTVAPAPLLMKLPYHHPITSAS